MLLTKTIDAISKTIMYNFSSINSQLSVVFSREFYYYLFTIIIILLFYYTCDISGDFCAITL